MMNSSIRQIVSKKKRRYRQDGYDLDLTYITERVIAMGYPAVKMEGIYRNKQEDVSKFLNEKHKGHFMVYNLCLEKSYDPSLFEGRVRRYPFKDHNPPPLKMIRPFCEDVQEWLDEHPLNVAAIHCKAGKGRTGLMITAYLMHSRMTSEAGKALDYYSKKRTYNNKGVTIPSQIRYVYYYSMQLLSNHDYNPKALQLKEIILPDTCLGKGPYFLKVVQKSDNSSYTINITESRRYSDSSNTLQAFNSSPDSTNSYIRVKVAAEESKPYREDIRIEFYKTALRKVKIFTVWLNTHFIIDGERRSAGHKSTDNNLNQNGSSTFTQMLFPDLAHNNTPSSRCSRDALYEEEEVSVNLTKPELDVLHKDKKHKQFPEDFWVQLLFTVTNHQTVTAFDKCSPIDDDLRRDSANACAVASARLVSDTTSTPSTVTPVQTDEDENTESDTEEEMSDYDSVKSLDRKNALAQSGHHCESLNFNHTITLDVNIPNDYQSSQFTATPSQAAEMCVGLAHLTNSPSDPYNLDDLDDTLVDSNELSTSPMGTIMFSSNFSDDTEQSINSPPLASCEDFSIVSVEPPHDEAVQISCRVSNSATPETLSPQFNSMDDYANGLISQSYPPLPLSLPNKRQSNGVNHNSNSVNRETNRQNRRNSRSSSRPRFTSVSSSVDNVNSSRTRSTSRPPRTEYRERLNTMPSLSSKLVLPVRNNVPVIDRNDEDLFQTNVTSVHSPIPPNIVTNNRLETTRNFFIKENRMSPLRKRSYSNRFYV